jgi:hypothetical protein
VTGRLARLPAYDVVWTAVIVVGAITSLFARVPAAVVMLTGLLGSIATHLLVGVVGYRRVMAREWPKVEPIDDDEW